MLGFLRRHRLLIAIAACLLVSGGLVISSYGRPVRGDRLGRVFVDVLAPFQRSATLVSDTVADLWRGITGVFRLRDQVKVLRRELRERNRQLAHLREIQLENERLRELLAFRREVRGDVITARVIGRDALGVSRALIINRGTTDGVHKGVAVLAPDGVVGHVFLAGRQAARVLLVTDHNSGVDGLVQRTRARGIVEGTATGACGLKFVKRTEALAPDDLVVTSGVDGIFPKGLPIGRIASIDKRGRGLFQYATVEPTVDFGALEEVLVIRSPASSEDPVPAEAP
jgi:rod shape-determining protein MreC